MPPSSKSCTIFLFASLTAAAGLIRPEIAFATISGAAVIGQWCRQQHRDGEDRVLVALGLGINAEGIDCVADAAGQISLIIAGVAPALDTRWQHTGVFTLPIKSLSNPLDRSH